MPASTPSPSKRPRTEPFPDRITHGCPETAAALRTLAASAARKAEHAEREVEAAGSGAAEAAGRYRDATRERRALLALAALHEAHGVPAPLYTLRTRRHVRAVLSAEDLDPTTAAALRSALRWTRGLPMRRATGFALMREGFDRLGLLGPVPLPLAVAQALQTEHPATPEPAEAFAAAVEAATATCFDGETGFIARFPSIDFTAAFEQGLSPEEAAARVLAWIAGGAVFDPRHVERAAGMLAPGGRLVAVVPESCRFRRDAAHRTFRAFVDDHGGHWIDLPAGAFQESGTGVKTRLVVLDV